MQAENEKAFLVSTLKVQYEPTDSLQPTATVTGLGMELDYHNQLNDKHYAATHPEILQPAGNAICAMQYLNGTSAAVAYKGPDYHSFVMGFPFECIKEEKIRNSLMAGILKYLTE